jgi:hypothetical protein
MRHDEELALVINSKNLKLWIDGQIIFSMSKNPKYSELRDSFGDERRVHLKAGWNQFLVKVTAGDRGPALIFYLRFKDGQGVSPKGLLSAGSLPTRESPRLSSGQSYKARAWSTGIGWRSPPTQEPSCYPNSHSPGGLP